VFVAVTVLYVNSLRSVPRLDSSTHLDHGSVREAVVKVAGMSELLFDG
jgi:hypothetical protein